MCAILWRRKSLCSGLWI